MYTVVSGIIHIIGISIKCKQCYIKLYKTCLYDEYFKCIIIIYIFKMVLYLYVINILYDIRVCSYEK